MRIEIKTSLQALLRIALSTCALALGACEESTMVGSGCPNGICPNALSRSDDACMTTLTIAEIAISEPEDAPTASRLGRVCLPAPLARKDDETIDGHVYYFTTDPSEPPLHCADKPFLRPASDAVRDGLVADCASCEVCEVNQLSVSETDAGASSVAAGDGFFYDDFSEEALTQCDSRNMINITEDALPWDGVVVMVTTAETRNESGEVDRSLACDPRAGSEPVGTQCLPAAEQYDDSQVVLETRAQGCGDGVCMAYHLGGNTDPSCDGLDTCATPEQLEERVYCTCRCDGPPGTANLCDCPNGFSCVDVVPTTQSDLAGSYCVRNGRE